MHERNLTSEKDGRRAKKNSRKHNKQIRLKASRQGKEAEEQGSMEQTQTEAKQKRVNRDARKRARKTIRNNKEKKSISYNVGKLKGDCQAKQPGRSGRMKASRMASKI